LYLPSPAGSVCSSGNPSRPVRRAGRTRAIRQERVRGQYCATSCIAHRAAIAYSGNSALLQQRARHEKLITSSFGESTNRYQNCASVHVSPCYVKIPSFHATACGARSCSPRLTFKPPPSKQNLKRWNDRRYQCLGVNRGHVHQLAMKHPASSNTTAASHVRLCQRKRS
jgi:hypothetical protein